MQWQPGFYWKEMEGCSDTYLGGSMRSKEVAILLWEEHALPPAIMWQWQVLHKGHVKAQGGEATKALGTIAAQSGYSSYLGHLTAYVPETSSQKRRKYIWAPINNTNSGDGLGIGRVPRDLSVRMWVSKCAKESDLNLWSFLVKKGDTKIASGYRGSKHDAVIAAEEAYDESTNSQRDVGS